MPTWFLFVAVGVVLAAFLAYVPALEVGWVFDDETNIVDATGVHWAEVSAAALEGLVSETMRPRRIIANLSFALNHLASGLDPFGYHLTNILIHLATGTALLWMTLLYLRGAGFCEDRRIWLGAVVSAGLFLLHPLNTQAVTYVVQRMSSLAGMLCVLAFGAYLRARLTAGRRTAASWLVLSVVLWLLALGSKENALLLPVVALVWELSFRRAWWRCRIAELRVWSVARAGVLASVVAGVGIGGWLALRRYLGSTGVWLWETIPGRDFSGVERVLTQARVGVLYLRLLIWPSPGSLTLEHDVAVSRGLLDPPTTLLALVFWAAVVVGSIVLARRRPVLGFPLLAYLVLHVIEAGPISLELVFEHRMYLPMAFLALLPAGALLSVQPQRARAAVGVATVVAVVLGAWTHARNTLWAQPMAFYADIAQKAPNKATALDFYGTALLEAGRPEEAIPVLERAMRADTHYYPAYVRLGNALLAAGRASEALDEFRRALTVGVAPDAYWGIARSHLALGDTAQAVQHLKDAGVQFGMGRRGRWAEILLRRAVLLAPDDSEAHNQLGNAYLMLEREEEALAEYRAAVQLDGTNAEAVYNLALLLDRRGDGVEAARYYRLFTDVAPPRLGQHVARARERLAALEPDEDEAP